MKRKDYLFLLLYTINIVCVFGFGSIRIPGAPLNFGQITSISIIFYCAFVEKIKFWDKYQFLFWLFYLFFGFSSFITGYGAEFLSSLTRKVFGVVSVYWSAKLLIKKYQTIIPILLPIVIVGALDSIMTICQCYGYHYFDSLSLLLGTSMEDAKIEYMERRDITFGVSLKGLYQTDVLNGHYLLFIFMYSLYFLKEKISIPRLFFPIVTLTGLFFCQERSAFFLSIIGLCSIMMFLIKRGVLSGKKIVFFAIAVFFVLILLLDFNEFTNSSAFESRIFNLDNSSRDRLNEGSIDFIYNHLITGGHFLYIDLIGLPPHNLFYDAIISGGIIGGLILLYMICIQIIYILKSIKYNIRIETFIFSMTFICILLDSFSHNTGYIQADSLTWLSWAIAMCYIKIDSNHYYKNIN